MPTSSEIVQRYSADNSQFRSVMNQSERIAGQTGKAIFKNLDLRDAGRTLATALGLNLNNIAENLARFVIGFSKDTQAALEKTVELTDRAADAQERALERMRAAKQKESDEAVARATKEFELIRDARLKGIAEEEAQRKRIRQNDYDAQVSADEAHMKSVKENLELLTLEAKAKQGLTIEEGARLKVLKEQTAENERQEQIAGLLSINNRTQEEEAVLQTLIRQSAQYKASLKVVAATTDEIKKITPAIESNIAKWREFIGVIKSTGRGDKELSDRELERKIANIQSELSASRGASLGRYQGSAGTGISDFLTQQQAGALNLAQGELDFRNQVRNAARTFGEDAAFRQFTGLSEQRFREILQSAPGTADVVAELKKLNGHLQKGVPTVLFGTEDNAA